ncbi:MAG: hypothetical protein VZS44_12170 [Bacilli bacterium]|nr:hypothetical protein [Bacilli bacterium]
MKKVSMVFLLLLLVGLVGCGKNTEPDNVITLNPDEIPNEWNYPRPLRYGTKTPEELAEQYFNALATSDYDYLQECIPKDATLTDAYDGYKELADTGYFYTYDIDHLKITKYNIKSDEIQMKVTCSCEEGHPGSMYRSKAELNIIVYQKDDIYYIDQNQSDKYITTTDLVPISDY